MHKKAPTPESAQVAVAVTAVSLILLLGKLVAQAYYPALNFDGASTIALAVLAAVPWLARLVDLIKFGEFQVNFRVIEDRQTKQRAELDEHAKYLAQIFAGLVGDQGRQFLEYLRDKKPYVYKYNDETKQEYRTMLRQLRLLGFITTKESVAHLIDDKRPNVDLTQEVALTQVGSTYLDSPIGRASNIPGTPERDA